MIVELSYLSRRYIGRFSAPLTALFPSLQESLARSGIYVPADAYVSFMFLVSAIVGVAVGVNASVIALTLSKEAVFSAVVGFAAFVVGGMFAMVFTYIYPSIGSGKKQRSIDEALPYTISFMGILSSSGVAPKRVMRSLAQLEKADVGLGGEATVMYRDMELLGGNLVSVLKDEAKKNISPLLSGILDGFISTVRSGGDLGGYFQNEAKGLMRLRRSILKEFVDVLVMISEMYMGLMVAFPLILIVMLVVMSSIGGGSIGGMGPEVLVPLVVYGMVPGSGAVILLMLDSLSPG